MGEGGARRPAFSLIEVLLAIFILGIGVISVAALFPAGIAQQRQSADDLIGPMVAGNAIELIRMRVRPEDFGTMEEQPGSSWFAEPPCQTMATIPGDFPWMRPGIILEDDPATVDFDERGTYDLFSSAWPTPPLDAATEFPAGAPWAVDLFGIPFSTWKYGAGSGNAPRIVITQGERFYPMHSDAYSIVDRTRPQFVWDCMFRRFGGRVQVAIFVYRVAMPGGAQVNYSTPKNWGNAEVPPLPISLPFLDDDCQNLVNDDVCADGPWDVGGLDDDVTTQTDNAFVAGMADGEVYDPRDHRHAWQEAGQWLLDQNNNIHRVLSRFREDEAAADGDMQVELVRPATAVPAIPVYFLRNFNTPYTDVVNHIWYLPVSLDLDTDGDDTPDTDVTLTPVYITVKEL